MTAGLLASCGCLFGRGDLELDLDATGDEILLFLIITCNYYIAYLKVNLT